MTATWLEYPDRLNFETTGELLRFIEKHPEVLVMYRTVRGDKKYALSAKSDIKLY